MEEARLRTEIERARIASRYQTPKFEELLRQERQRRQRAIRSNFGVTMFSLTVTFVLWAILSSR